MQTDFYPNREINLQNADQCPHPLPTNSHNSLSPDIHVLHPQVEKKKKMAFIPSIPFLASKTHRKQICTQRRTPKASIQPLHDRVLIRPDAPESETASGLILTSSETEKKSTTGTVIAVGPGRYSGPGWHEPMDFAEGDRVLWKDEYGAEIIPVDGEDLLALRVFSISAKI